MFSISSLVTSPSSHLPRQIIITLNANNAADSEAQVQAPASDAVEDGGRKKVVQHTLARVIQTERVNEGDSVKCYSIDTLFPQSLE